MAVQKPKLDGSKARKAVDYATGATDGSRYKLPKIKIDKQKKYNLWKSSKFGGKVPFKEGAKHIGGQLKDAGADVLKFIKKHDPQNSSGSVKDALDIMQKLEKATQAPDLYSAMIPMKEILGGKLYSAFQAAGSQSKAKQQAHDAEEPTEDIVMELILAAIAKVSEADADKGEQAANLLNKTEITAVRAAYKVNGTYASTYEIPEFVTAINELIPLYKVREQLGNVR